ncbi:MAG TPA: UDP-N-acetylmuramoyl-L-alanyl-D-glutamate--2,6-diaminopimelate ligase [Rhizobacter sp.]|nr:UDP-N-acetylmuramoyl-L-alanyl-D-glutamate--2,6-diaminopimelate ligase [Rhizobacter sp.]
MAPLTAVHDVGSAVAWLRSRGVHNLSTDSRRMQAGDAFIAWPGYANDGRQFVPAALAAGAAACLVEAKGAEAFAFDGTRVAAMHGLKAATGPLASTYLEHPSHKLDVVAVTGTNGKTSVAWWVAQALSLLGRRCGVVGTLGVGEPPSAASPNASVLSTGLTTPDPVTLQTAFRRFVDSGFSACAIEASSIGIVEQRLAGTRIGVALFTNFTRDHIDYHGDMDTYWAAKAQLFAWPGLRAAVLNVDDERGAALAPTLTGLDVWTYSTRKSARLLASDIVYRDGGLAFTLHENATTAEVRSGLIGDYNVSNLLALIGGLRALGVPLADAARVCAQLTPVPGRMQSVSSTDMAGGPAVVVDYAHTPDALEKALQALRPLARERGGQLWGVFGCGGNRDATKRPLMGAIAEREADRVVVTSDNPRNEQPGEILKQIAAGMAQPDRAQVIEDRRAAIVQAVVQAQPQDVILIAGKGHEPDQEIAGVKHPFSDVEEAQAALAQRGPR